MIQLVNHNLHDYVTTNFNVNKKIFSEKFKGLKQKFQKSNAQKGIVTSQTPRGEYSSVHSQTNKSSTKTTMIKSKS